MQPDQVPTPDNANIPLIEGIDPSWNDLVRHIPEDKRAEAAPTIKEWQQRYTSTADQVKQWDSLKGVDPQRAEMAVTVLDAIENQPEMVFESLQKHLGYTPQQARQFMEENSPNGKGTGEEGGTQQQQIDLSSHPEYQKMQQQLHTLAQIALARKQEEDQTTTQQRADQELQSELDGLTKKHGELPDWVQDQVMMRMHSKGMSAQDAYDDYMQISDRIRAERRPAPFVLGGGGPVPREQVDVKKLDRSDTKRFVAQMLENTDGG